MNDDLFHNFGYNRILFVNLISEFLSRSRARYTAGNLRFQPVPEVAQPVS